MSNFFVLPHAPNTTDEIPTGTGSNTVAGVSSLNGLQNDVVISAGTGITVNTSGNDIVVNATGGSSGSGTGNVSGTGVPNTIAIWGGSETIQNSIISQPNNSTVYIAGHLTSATKSFTIPHPTQSNKNLVYGCLEGPEHAVYHRGHAAGMGEVIIELPEYWNVLVGLQYTVILTPCNKNNLYVKTQSEKTFTVDRIGVSILRRKYIEFNYLVIGSRTDAPLEIIQDL